MKRRGGSPKRSAASWSGPAEAAARRPARGAGGRALAGLVAATLLCGCALAGRSSDRLLLERSAKRRPEWIVRAPESERWFYVTGAATGSPSLAEGRKSAALAAVEDILFYLGLRASARYEERRSAYAAELQSELDSEARGRVGGGRAAEVYFERYRDRVTGAERFDVFVLFRVPAAELEAERARLAAEREAAEAEAERVLASVSLEAFAADLAGVASRLVELHRGLRAIDPASAFLGRIETALAEAAARLSLRIGRLETAAGSDGRVLRVRVAAGLVGPSGFIPVQNAAIRAQAAQGLARSEAVAVTGRDGEAEVELLLPVGPSRGGIVRARLGSLVLRREEEQGRVPAGLGAALDAFGRVEASAMLPHAVFSSAGGGDAEEGREAASSALPAADAAIEVRAGSPVLEPGGAGLALPVLVRLLAPSVTSRPPLNLGLVLDVSGSMSAPGKLAYSKKAAELAVRSLAETDFLAVVTFATEASVLLPSRPFPGRRTLLHRLDMLEAGGRTNLSAGIEEGLGQLLRERRPWAASRLVVLTDGIANEGITDAAGLERLAERVRAAGVSLSVVGLGRDLDGGLLRRMAAAGGGNFHFAATPQDLPRVLAAETEGLVREALGHIEVALELARGVQLGKTYGYPVRLDNDGIAIPAGSLPAGEWRTLLFELRGPCAEEGLRRVGSVTVRFRDWQRGGRWRSWRQELFAHCAARPPADGAAPDSYVNFYARLLRALEDLEFALNSGDSDLAAEVRRFAEEELPAYEAEAESLADRDLLDLVALYRHGAEEVERWGTASHEHRGPGATNGEHDFAHRLYLLRHHGKTHALLRPD